MRERWTVLIAFWVASGIVCIAADKPPDPAAQADVVQFTIRICEGKEKLRFWFNEEAEERWNTCPVPVPNVPVFLVTDSGTRAEGKTGPDGIAELTEVSVARADKFRLAMACTTHNCFSIQGLFVGA